VTLIRKAGPQGNISQRGPAVGNFADCKLESKAPLVLAGGHAKVASKGAGQRNTIRASERSEVGQPDRLVKAVVQDLDCAIQPLGSGSASG
jgi:hypothetical protein